MNGQFSDDWKRGKELSITTAKGIRSLINWLKQFWMHRSQRRIAEKALERYYITEYKNMSASIRKDRISRDIIKMQSGY